MGIPAEERSGAGKSRRGLFWMMKKLKEMHFCRRWQGRIMRQKKRKKGGKKEF
jgi:hypothetical protein